MSSATEKCKLRQLGRQSMMTLPLATCLVAAAGCTEVNVPPLEQPVINVNATPPTPAATAPVDVEGGDGTPVTPQPTMVPDPGTMPVDPGTAVTDPNIMVILAQADSGYEELRELVSDMAASDVNGHLDQNVLAGWAETGFTPEQAQFLFNHGDELSEIQFTQADGIGSLQNIDGQGILRFNRTPQGGRVTGPNATACIACHDQPLGNGGGLNNDNVLQDPDPTLVGDFNFRNSRNVNGDAWLELAAREMTTEIQGQAQAARDGATAAPNTMVSMDLASKGVSFGSLTCTTPNAATPPVCDYSNVDGLSLDLVVRAFGWKGDVTSLRSFSENAFFGELGMHSDRLTFDLVGTTPTADVATGATDVDGDGVVNELSVGDITGMTFYFASQAPPTTYTALADEGLVNLQPAELQMINTGEQMFQAAMCNTCHVMALPVTSSVFIDPDPSVPQMMDSELAAQPSNGYDPARPIRLDLASDPVVERTIAPDANGVFQVRALSDLKRHNLGAHLCDPLKPTPPIDASFNEVQVPADAMNQNVPTRIDICEFLTPPLWGIAGTAPYLHDGRATTLREAIATHCDPTGAGEANTSCVAFQALAEDEQNALVVFLLNQVFVPEP